MNKLEERRLTTAQARWLQVRVGTMQRLLSKVHKRLVSGRYERNLIESVGKAQQEQSSLNVTLHYESIKEGVGRSPKAE